MKNIFRIIKLSQPLHRLMALISLVVVISAAFEVVAPLLSGKILDEVIKQAGAADKQYDTLLRLLGISLGTTIGYLITRSIGQR
ncbi:hypothetical protein KC571_02110, partial [candidate division WWE3 bacterium]|nr:hypothetical protein [candidate division WWE3 bacterium]